MKETTTQRCPWCDSALQMRFDCHYNKHLAICDKCKLELASETLDGIAKLVKHYYDKRVEAEHHAKVR